MKIAPGKGRGPSLLVAADAIFREPDSNLYLSSKQQMPEVKTIVRAGRVVPAHDKAAIPDGAVAVAGEKIAAVGSFEALSAKYPNADVIGGDDFLLIPGLINGHGHGRGLTDFQRGALDNTLAAAMDTVKARVIEYYRNWTRKVETEPFSLINSKVDGLQ